MSGDRRQAQRARLATLAVSPADVVHVTIAAPSAMAFNFKVVP